MHPLKGPIGELFQAESGPRAKHEGEDTQWSLLERFLSTTLGDEAKVSL